MPDYVQVETDFGYGHVQVVMSIQTSCKYSAELVDLEYWPLLNVF